MKKILLVLIVCFLSNVYNAEAGRSNSSIEQAKQIERYYGLYHDENVQKRIHDLGMLLVKTNGLNEEDFIFKVLNSGEINAVTLPGGHIYIYKGLIDYMQSDDEIAAVIAHEMGHVVGKHIVKREREQLLAMLLGGLVGGPEGAIALSAALAALPEYGQKEERDADDKGFQYMYEAKLNPYAMLIIMNRLYDSEETKIRSNFSSHPEPEVRAERVKKYIEKLKISPIVEEQKDGSAVVKDGAWIFTVTKPNNTYKPLYRAWFLAGNLYAISKDVKTLKEHFIVVENKESADIYYGKKIVFTVAKEDVLGTGKSLAEKANEYVSEFQRWVLLQQI